MCACLRSSTLQEQAGASVRDEYSANHLRNVLVEVEYLRPGAPELAHDPVNDVAIPHGVSVADVDDGPLHECAVGIDNVGV